MHWSSTGLVQVTGDVARYRAHGVHELRRSIWSRTVDRYVAEDETCVFAIAAAMSTMKARTGKCAVEAAANVGAFPACWAAITMLPVFTACARWMRSMASTLPNRDGGVKAFRS